MNGSRRIPESWQNREVHGASLILPTPLPADQRGTAIRPANSVK